MELVTYGSMIHCTLSQETLGDLEPFICYTPQVPVIGLARAMKEPGTDSFSLGHFNGGDKITVTGNKRNMGYLPLDTE